MTQNNFLENKIRAFEHYVAKNSDDINRLHHLIILLHVYNPSNELGPLSSLQKTLGSLDFIENCQSLNEHSLFELLSQKYLDWMGTIRSRKINIDTLNSQPFTGEGFPINMPDKATCDLAIQLFNAKKIIPRFCFSCHKVQIVASSVAWLIFSYLILRKLKLPNNNLRKSMIELRLGIGYPYKSYIFCASEEEAINCKSVFDKHLKENDAIGVFTQISHGCSEYATHYPQFKYSAEGDYKEFKYDNEWRSQEDFFWENAPTTHGFRPAGNSQFVTLCDVVSIRTWIAYAKIIGDDSHEMFGDDVFITPRFYKRVREQADIRNQQLAALRNRHT